MLAKDEFERRKKAVIKILNKNDLRACLIYYDELNIGNGWYLSGWCPQFESGSILVTDTGYAAILGGPESEPFAKMDCTIKETKNIPVFMVPDEEYPYAEITDFKSVFSQIFGTSQLDKIGVVGLNSMPYGVYSLLTQDLEGTSLVDITGEYEALRIKKSAYEIEMMQKASDIADSAFKKMLDNVQAGVAETYLAGVAEGQMRMLGANRFGFQTIVAAGKRSCGVVPTATDRKLKEGEMVMLGISPRYRGYAAAAGYSTVVGGNPTSQQKEYLKILSEAYLATKDMLKPGMAGRNNYRQIKEFFAGRGGYEKYIVCPFVHTIGLHEAEAPFFGPHSDDVLEPGMTVCIDVSLFGHPGFHGMRLETAFLITPQGHRPFSSYMDKLISGLSAG